MQVQSLGQGDPLEEGMAIHSNILAWRIKAGRANLWIMVVTVTRKLGSVCPTIICNCKSPKALKISFFGEVGGVLALKCLSEENLT